MDRESITHHISQQFNADLEDLRNRVLMMGGLLEQQISRAVESLIDGNTELAQMVIKDDHKVNYMEVAIDEQCNMILARRNPAAGDLRLVIAVIKTITDLERMADQAKKVAKLGIDLSSIDTPPNHYIEIKTLGELVLANVHSMLDAFATLDVQAALDVSRKDADIDLLYNGIIRQMITFMMEDPRTIKRSLDVLWAARALERIGDHATNICEYIIFLIKGKDVRHTTMAEKEREVLDSE